MLKLELNCQDRLDKMQSIMKTKQNNKVTNRKGVIFIEYDTKMSRPIEQCAIYDKDEIEKWRDWSYRSSLS